MNELEYIENYFSNKLSADDKLAFEKRCESDIAFAQEVGFYILTRQNLKDALIKKKKLEFLEQYRELANNKPALGEGRGSWLVYAAAVAASLLLLVVYLTFFQTDTPEQLADAYIDQNLTMLSTTMGSGTDSLTIAIGAFNDKDYKRAENMFRSLESNADLAPEPTKYLGITHLITGQYEKAIEQFNKLISFTDLYANPGKFYLAVTLMKRSAEGDKEEARELLQEIVTKELPGYKEASVWMKHL
jgi:tetratricopeptide (TPR) repeat protein